MNDPNQEKLLLKTEADQYSVAPGGSLDIPLVLTNRSEAPDQVRIIAEGIPLAWVSTRQPVVMLQPGEERQIILIVRPPVGADAHAGRYVMRLRAASTLGPTRSVEVRLTLTVAGYEVKGRVGVLMDTLQYAAVPGEQLNIPVVLINQGLSPDTFSLAVQGLADGMVAIAVPTLRLESGEVQKVMLIIQPPRNPDSRAGRQTFQILVTSLEAPDQGARIDCTLTMAAFTELSCSLVAAQPDKKLPARVRVQNLSNVSVTYQVSWTSSGKLLVFDPAAPQPVNLPSGETSELGYTLKPANRLWFGAVKSYTYSVTVQVSGQEPQILEGKLEQKPLLPVWLAFAAGALLLVCLCLVMVIFLRRVLPGQPTAVPTMAATTAPLVTDTPSGPLPTATQSQTDQKPLLVERKWYLVAYNSTNSTPGVQEAYTLFNPDGTLIAYTGCKDLSGNYKTNFNEITISNINLGKGTCPDNTLQQQEDAMVAILKSARSYFVADTAMQIAGGSGFLNYSLTPMSRPEEVVPPKAVIKTAPQAQTGIAIVFDGSASSGQVPIVAWKWEFSDGKTASGVIVQHTYTIPGAFTVKLTVTDQNQQTGVSTTQILILPPPTLTPSKTVKPPTHTPTVKPPTKTPTVKPPTKTPTVKPPTKTPTVKPPAPTEKPVEPTATTEPPVQVVPPAAKIKGPGAGYLGEPVAFDASASVAGSSPIVSYSWTFGNGTSKSASGDPKATKIYDTTGNYEVTVTIVDANGLISEATTNVVIDARLNTQVWTLSAANGKSLVPGTAITLQFLQGNLAGFAGCNTYNGTYTAADNGDGTYTTVIGTISAGKQACPADIMNQESSYLGALKQVTGAGIQENMLTLTYPSGTLVYYLIGPTINPQ